MEKNLKPDIQLPPGFRFHPSDEELIVHYLRKKTTKTPLPASIVAEVELYKFNPWDLPNKSLFGDEEWYFFTPRDRKYPNGMRPNRTAASGYWKATGIDKPILTSCGSKVIGVKKALVFYTGRPPKGNKTDWIMHEYKLPEPDPSCSTRKEKSMRLDEWVLCRVRQKTGMPFGNVREDTNGPSSNAVQHHPKLDKQCSTETSPNFEMVKDYLYKDCPMLPFLFGSQDFPSMDTAVPSISFEGNSKASSISVCEDNFNIDYLQSSATPPHVRKRKLFDQGNGEEQDNFRHSNKKATNEDCQKEEEQLRPSSNNDYADHSGMIFYSPEKNNYVDHLCPNMMYQELYSLAFTFGRKIS